ncbi:MAG: right-handed parallel beta-helix repeat-containing protein [Candidatus Bathyarchaeum sp.]|nr:MAG: right-handed parallel beta-helix repeat-containing protein [Candidatus Bathyarchaeum sp.]
MSRKTALATAFITVVLCSSLVGAQLVNLAAANIMPFPTPQQAFTIRSDGSVDPPTASIQRNGEIYTLTDDITEYTIVIERDNVTLDGGGYTLQGTGNSTGVFVNNRRGITVRNMEIRNYFYGIRLLTDLYARESTGNHTLSGNNIADNNYGIYLGHTSNNVLRNNQMNDNTVSLSIIYSSLGDDIASFTHDIDTSNTVNGKPVHYWVNQQNKAVPPDAGYIGLINCTNMLVQNLDLTGDSQAVLLVSTTYSTITKNAITNNSEQGIYLYKSSNNSISENSLANNAVSGIYLYHSSNNIISENTITENNQDGIYLFNSSHNSMNGNTVTLNNEGIHVYSRGTNNSIVGNTITENNGYGISLEWVHNNFVSENYIVENGGGILVSASSNNRIIGNTVKENNGWGIRLEGRDQRNNVIYHNYFIDNNVEAGFQVSIPGLFFGLDDWRPGNPNVWNNGTVGNYWSDYLTRYTNATEIEGTGVGDTPFYINPNNIDNYPVMKQHIIPEFPTWTPMLLTLIILAIAIAHYKRRLPKTRKR